MGLRIVSGGVTGLVLMTIRKVKFKLWEKETCYGEWSKRDAC